MGLKYKNCSPEDKTMPAEVIKHANQTVWQKQPRLLVQFLIGLASSIVLSIIDILSMRYANHNSSGVFERGTAYFILLLACELGLLITLSNVLLFTMRSLRRWRWLRSTC